MTSQYLAILIATLAQIALCNQVLSLPRLFNTRGDVSVVLKIAYDRSLIVRGDNAWQRMVTQPPNTVTTLFNTPPNGTAVVIPTRIGIVVLTNASLTVYFAALTHKQ
jgi:hypothetical protein